MSYIGLLLILIAWIRQYTAKSSQLQKTFFLLYIAGTGLLVAGSLRPLMPLLLLMNLAIGAVTLMTFRKMGNRGRR